jgi:hypothetical protein
VLERMIERQVADQHAEALRRAEVMRQVRGPRGRASRGHGRVRLRVARRLVAVAERLDPEAPVVTLPQRDAGSAARRVA